MSRRHYVNHLRGWMTFALPSKYPEKGGWSHSEMVPLFTRTTSEGSNVQRHSESSDDPSVRALVCQEKKRLEGFVGPFPAIDEPICVDFG